MATFPWSVLGIKKTSDVRVIKSAYAAKLKVTRPDDDPVAFQRLVEARDRAIIQSKTAVARIGSVAEPEERPQQSKSSATPRKKKPGTTAKRIVSAEQSPQPQAELRSSLPNIVDAIAQILDNDEKDPTQQDIDEVAKALQEMPLAQKIQSEVDILSAVNQYLLNDKQEKRKLWEQDRKLWQLSYRTYLIATLNAEYAWTENERHVQSLGWFLEPDFSERLRKTIDPNYTPGDRVNPLKSITRKGWITWIMLIVVIFIFRGCGN